jgi:hypothetical protein
MLLTINRRSPAVQILPSYQVRTLLCSNRARGSLDLRGRTFSLNRLTTSRSCFLLFASNLFPRPPIGYTTQAESTGYHQRTLPTQLNLDQLEVLGRGLRRASTASNQRSNQLPPQELSSTAEVEFSPPRRTLTNPTHSGRLAQGDPRKGSF